jgi:hypothetical protein
MEKPDVYDEIVQKNGEPESVFISGTDAIAHLNQSTTM